MQKKDSVDKYAEKLYAVNLEVFGGDVVQALAHTALIFPTRLSQIAEDKEVYSAAIILAQELAEKYKLGRRSRLLRSVIGQDKKKNL